MASAVCSKGVALRIATEWRTPTDRPTLSKMMVALAPARSGPLARALDVPPRVLVPAYLACFVALDWATFIPAFSPLGITPWSPTTGLAFALVLLFGLHYLPLLALGPLITAVLVRDLPLPWWVEAGEVLLTSAGYALGLGYLVRGPRAFDPALSSIRDLALLVGVAIVSAAAVAAAYVEVVIAAGLLEPSSLLPAVLTYWVGEVIGITVLTPFLLIISTRLQPPPLSGELVLQIAAILASIAAVFWLAPAPQPELFYVLFLPIIWIAVRTGLEGVAAGLVLMQVGLMVALHLGRQEGIDVTAFQAVMLVLAFAGLAIGIEVSERRRAETRMRMHHDAVARVLRLGSMGELTTAIAHELNQPLTAIGNYARGMVRALDEGPHGALEAKEAARKTVAQVERAAEVIRRLRDLIRLGRSEIGPQSVRRLMAEALDLLAPDLAASHTSITADVPGGLPHVMADAVQIEQVLINLIRNGIEAMQSAGLDKRSIAISAQGAKPGFVEIRVRDAGPGFPVNFDLTGVAPMSSTKAEGLGFGLSLSRSIIEAHGGELTIDCSAQGGCVCFSLPTAGGNACD